MMYWLSIDPGNETGFALWENNTIIESGILRYKSHDDFCQKFPEWLKNKIYVNQVQHVAYEHPVTVGKHGNACLKTAEKCGIIIGVNRMFGGTVTAVNPQEVTKLIGSNFKDRRTRKIHTQNKVISLYGFKHARDEGQADAVAIGHAYLQLTKAA